MMAEQQVLRPLQKVVRRVLSWLFSLIIAIRFRDLCADKYYTVLGFALL